MSFHPIVSSSHQVLNLRLVGWPTPGMRETCPYAYPVVLELHDDIVVCQSD